MSSAKGIHSFAAYAPAHRLDKKAIAGAHAWALPSLRGLAKGEKAFCSYDEDSITMAVEASRRCLSEQPELQLDKLALASTSAPFADLQNAAIAASALGEQKELATADYHGSLKAGLNALRDACTSSDSKSLVCASENRRAKPGSVQEMNYGAAAGAALIGEGPGLANYLGSHSSSAVFFDHFRSRDGEYDYAWEDRWIRDEGIGKLMPTALQALLEKIGKQPGDIAHLGLTGGPRGSAAFLARKTKLDASVLLPDFAADLGDPGCALPLLQLGAALERANPGELIVLACLAQGCELIAFERSDASFDSSTGCAAAVNRRIPESSYMKYLSFSGEIELDWGMRAETDQKTALTQQYRYGEDIHGFVAGQCPNCDTVQFPRLNNCVNCGSNTELRPVSLRDAPATVATYTADWLQYCPAPPLYMGLVQFENGARVLMQMVDVGEPGLDVGTPLDMVFRIKEVDQQRGYRRYFWKAAPKFTGQAGA